jgi:small subunit ribosomal protein S5
VKVRRCATVVKGGRRFSFAGLVVVGNGRGKVGCGYGKANEVPPAVEKAIKDGMKNLIEVPVESGSIPHRVEGFSGTAKVIMLPASPGTGIIAGAAVRAVCEFHEPGQPCEGGARRPQTTSDPGGCGASQGCVALLSE